VNGEIRAWAVTGDSGGGRVGDDLMHSLIGVVVTIAMRLRAFRGLPGPPSLNECGTYTLQFEGLVRYHGTPRCSM